MQKILTIDHNKCTGCRICELVCSFTHTGEFNPELSRIRVVITENDGLLETIPVACRMCEKAVCETICPSRAIYRNPKTGALLVQEGRCLGCKVCLYACPLGGTIYDFKNKIATRCDLCDGDPFCVKFCPKQCIEYQYPDKVTQKWIRSYLYRVTNRELHNIYEEIKPGSVTKKGEQ